MHAYYIGGYMLIIEHAVETTVPAYAVWHIWQDVANWNTWDLGIEFSTSNGPFQAGTTGTVKPKGGPLVHTKLTRVEPMRLFVDEAKLPLARLVFTHSLTESGGKTQVAQRIEMFGFLAFFFAFVIGRDMKKNLPREMSAMIKKAEEYEKSRLEKNHAIRRSGA